MFSCKSIIYAVPIIMVALLIVLGLVWMFYTSYSNEFFKGQLIPLVSPYSIKLSLDIMHAERQRYNKFGRIYGRFDGSQPVLTIGERDLLKRVLLTDSNKFLNRRDMKSGESVFDHTLFVLEGHDWKRVRNIVSPYFTTFNLKKIINQLQDCCGAMISKMATTVEEGKEIDCQKFFSLFVVNSIQKCCFGINITDNDAFIEKAGKLFNSYNSIIPTILPWIMKFYRIPILNAETTNFYHNIMKEVIEERKKIKNGGYNDFLQRMIEHQENPQNLNNGTKDSLSYDEMVSQCITFFLAGHESTTSLLSHCIYRIAMNEEVQKKAVEEMNNAFKNPKDSSFLLNAETIIEKFKNLKYLEAIIMECTRICPAMARIERRAAEDYYFPERPIHVKKDCIISIPVFAIHNDPEYYPQPEAFNPERFMNPERKDFTNIFFPFGSGVRECVAKNLCFSRQS